MPIRIQVLVELYLDPDPYKEGKNLKKNFQNDLQKIFYK